jgi:hypothetical protein
MGRKAFQLAPPITPKGLIFVDDGREKPDPWKERIIKKLQNEANPGTMKGDWAGVSSQSYTDAPGIPVSMKLVSSLRSK